MAISERQIQTLRELESANRSLAEIGYRGGWAKPLDCGGSDRSHHSETLTALHRRGLIDRKGYSTSRRTTWVYKINDSGKALLTEKGFSNQDVRRERTIARLLSQIEVDKSTGCWNWTGTLASGGYGQIFVDNVSSLTHRLSYEIHRGPIPDSLFICHHCDNRRCCNPSHLFVGTAADNHADMMAKGRNRILRGADIGTSKLTEADVAAIRSAVGMTQEQIASQYGISRSYVANLRQGRGWAHMKK